MATDAKLKKASSKKRKRALSCGKLTKTQIEMGWNEAGFPVNDGTATGKYFSLFSLTKQKSKLEAPVGWMMRGQSDHAVKCVEKWNRSVVKKKGNLDRLAGQIFEEISERMDCLLEGQSYSPAIEEAIVSLGAAQCVRAIAGKGDYMRWHQLVQSLLDLSQAVESKPDADPLVHQLLAIELPVTIGFQLSDNDEFRQLANRSCRKFELTVTGMMDHDGWPHSRYLPDFGPCLASWARTNRMLVKLGMEIQSDVAAQLEWSVRQALRLLGPDDRLLFGQPDGRPMSAAMAKVLATMTSDPTDERLLNFRLGKKSTKEKSKRSKKKFPLPSNISEWAESALFQATWKKGSPKIGLDFSNKRCRMVVANSQALIDGDVMPRVFCNGNELESLTDFEVVCELCDEDIDYLEIEMELSGEAVLNRQVILSRTESFLFLADSVVPPEASNLDYDLRLPYAENVKGMAETENREIYLCGPKIKSLVLPLALPEWKSVRTRDRFVAEDSGLLLSQRATGKGLYAPLFFDLDPKRSKKKRTWRQLTVGEDRLPVAKQDGCAYRIQLNSQQWFLYRAIASKGNRTFLGENFNGEFVFNRFEKDGTVTQLMEIDD